MKINNLNYDKIEYKGNKMEEQLSVKEIVNQFYNKVRQQMPSEGYFEDIQTPCTKDDAGEYFLTVHTFLNSHTNEYTNSLNVSYIPDDKDFKIGMNLLEGTKVEILDFLGNENNINKIESYMINLRNKADRK